ncbi:MAG: flagellar biosynthesis anti-sigma factor FlgM [Halanaerobiales bacterium]|nr:flagellar biosynthesis anti-sigma factor FlgM [Halanaerobiales bacterium]
MRVYQTNNQKVRELNSHKMKGQKIPINEQGSDKITISPQALNVKELKKDLAQIPELRMERIQDLRKQIQLGTYQVSGQAIARKIFNQDELE